MSKKSNEPTGFAHRVKGKKRYYYYVRRNFLDENGVHTWERLVSLGKKEDALEKLNAWLNNPSSIPVDVKKRGFNEAHIADWLRYVEKK